MIRVALATALAGLAATPALAYSVSSMPAPRAPYHFVGNRAVARLAAAGGSVSSQINRQPPTAAQLAAPRTLVELPRRGRVASRIDWSDADDNPFMAAPLRDKPAR